ncbi:MerC domain-containing protein [Sphingorhabdus sp. 109]|uniref:MerC domain-containing protein n=1 Tax=Sphingorhabdus sp. 109 TaxID=2653173 RepID=UPI00135B46AC|nr:MerC domain-containing protein [Sphingorhabdus sp. 109]
MTMSPQYANRIETSALFLSGLCVVHCIGLPLLFLVVPVFANVFAFPDAFHAYALLLAVPLSLTSLIYGASQHRSFTPLAIGTFGLLLMAVALSEKYHHAEVILTLLGASSVALAHLSNWRRRTRCAVAPGGRN